MEPTTLRMIAEKQGLVNLQEAQNLSRIANYEGTQACVLKILEYIYARELDGYELLSEGLKSAKFVSLHNSMAKLLPAGFARGDSGKTHMTCMISSEQRDTLAILVCILHEPHRTADVMNNDLVYSNVRIATLPSRLTVHSCL